MLASAPHLVRNVMKEVVPGCIMIVISSWGTPPTIKIGEAVPMPAPVLFTFTAYPQPAGAAADPAGKFVEQ